MRSSCSSTAARPTTPAPPDPNLARADRHEQRYDAPMEPDRFDDVAFRMIEEPEPPSRPPRRRRRWLVATAASVVLAGAPAPRASALAGSGEQPPAVPPP